MSNLESLDFSQKAAPEGFEKPTQSQYETLLGITGDEKIAAAIDRKLKELGQSDFKDSKMRNDKGELMLMWHGSPRDFDSFDMQTSGQWRWKNKGVHFSSSDEMVEQYSNKAINSLHTVIREIAYQDLGSSPEAGQEWYVGNEQWRTAVQEAIQVYNIIVRDLIEKGIESSYFRKSTSLSRENDPLDGAIQYKNRGFGMDWVSEIFGGQMPTEENTFFDEKQGMYLGEGIGRFKYLVALNIIQPHIADNVDESFGLDREFRLGEEEHARGMVDGTIIAHPTGIQDHQRGGTVQGTERTYSAGVFDSGQIYILGTLRDSGEEALFKPSKEISSMLESDPGLNG